MKWERKNSKSIERTNDFVINNRSNEIESREIVYLNSTTTIVVVEIAC